MEFDVKDVDVDGALEQDGHRWLRCLRADIAEFEDCTPGETTLTRSPPPRSRTRGLVAGGPREGSATPGEYASESSSRVCSLFTDIAEELGLSSSTVRTRITKLEENGIIRGYHVDIDYDLAGCPLYTKMICTAPVPERDRLANEARNIRGVTAVCEIMRGERNVYVNAIGKNYDDLNRISTELDALGLGIVDEQLIRDEYVCPYHGFLGKARS